MNLKFLLLKEKFKKEASEIIATALLSGKDETVLKACIKALVNIVAYIYDLKEIQSKELENIINYQIQKFLEGVK